MFLNVLDQLWREHLAAMDYLRQGIHLRGYAQKDPKQEYKREAFLMFNEMLGRFKHQVVGILSKVQIQAESDVAAVEEQRRRSAEKRPLQFQHADAPLAAEAPPEGAPGVPAGAEGRPLEERAAAPGRPVTVVREQPKVGRNDPCPCGSGKKYKQCHGKLA
jgi:preprotein translocase subunit SecA